MRTDYLLYVVAVICFAIAALTIAWAQTLTDFERNLSLLATIVFGLFFIGLGFSQRPKTEPAVIQVPPTPPPTLSSSPPTPVEQPVLEQPVVEPITQPVAEPIVEERTEAAETPLPAIGITSVKGIKDKRAEQLKALGINSVEDLANSSAKDLASKLNISPKFTEKWIESAKDLVKKS